MSNDDLTAKFDRLARVAGLFWADVLVSHCDGAYQIRVLRRDQQDMIIFRSGECESVAAALDEVYELVFGEGEADDE